MAEVPAHVCFLQLKAFGDLVIAAEAIGRVSEADRDRIVLAIGRHLLPLCEAIAPPVSIVSIATREPGVPAAFDVRRAGLDAALISALQTRRAVARAPIDRGALVLLDRLGPRERFIAGRRRVQALPSEAANIYLGYDDLIRRVGLDVATPTALGRRQRRRIGIFPGSRVAAKNLPVALVAELLRKADRCHVEAELFLLDGERPDLESSGLPHIIVPRSFVALRAAIAALDAIFSADSLPAHFAESLRVESFVITPKRNEFWMPRSVFERRNWELFDAPDLLERAGGFLAS